MNLERILCKICILLSSSNSPSLKTLEMCLAITEQSFCVCYCINKNSSSEPQNFRLSENEILALPFRTEDKRINSFSKRPNCFSKTSRRFDPNAEAFLKNVGAFLGKDAKLKINIHV